MGAFFSKPQVPGAPPVAPPAPTMDNAQANTDVAAREQAQRMQRGRSSTMITGGAGLSGGLGTTSKTLLGN